MDQEKFFKHGVFGVAIVALIAAAAISDSPKDGESRSFTITYEDDDRDYERSSNNRVTEDRDVETFTKIRIKGGIELDLKAGGDQSLSVTTSDNRIGYVETSVSDGILTIDLEDEGRKRFWNNTDVDVVISVASLEGIEVLGAVDGTLEGVNSDVFEIDIKGAADLNISGSCKQLNLDMKGAGDIDADDFKCENVDVDLKGAGDQRVYASEAVDAFMGGVGNIAVYGDPKDVSKRVGGIGNISIK